MYNMSAVCRKQMHSFDYLKNIYLHILFCTAAKHLFGIKMRAHLYLFLSLNITILIYTAYLLNIFSRDYDWLRW